MIIKYPVRYDDVNLTINDATGRVIALIGWPRLTIPVEEMKERGTLIAEAVNTYDTTKKMLESNDSESNSNEPEKEDEPKKEKKKPGRPKKS